jgi:hypothetical protein
MSESQSKSRKKRVQLTIETKLEIIKRKIDKEESDEYLANLYGIERSSVTKLIKDKEKYFNYANENTNSKEAKRCRIQIGNFFLVEEALYKWLCQARAMNIPISQSILQEKALFFFNSFKESNLSINMPSEFIASSGWLQKFQLRYNITSKIINGESESVSKSLVKNSIEEIRKVLGDYISEDIYNADELGLFYRLGPDRTLASAKDKAKGCKKNLQRITVLLACNASGTRKLKPFVIGHAAKPRCFKNISMASLPVRYASNDSAWMTGALWLDYLKWFDSQLTEDSILLADNCPAHIEDTAVSYKHLRVFYLPPNTTSHLQPLDAGIIKVFKAHYRKLLIKG